MRRTLTKSDMKDIFKNMGKLIESNNIKVTFGLQPDHIDVIEKELERFGNREIDAKYVKYVWEKIGKEIGWEPFTLALYYFEYLEDKNPELTTARRIKKECDQKINGSCPHHNLFCAYPKCEQ